MTEPAPTRTGLYVWLTFATAASLITAYILAVQGYEELDRGRSLPVPAILFAAGAAADLLGLAAVWTWRRWGVPLLSAGTALEVVCAWGLEVNGVAIAARIILTCALLFMLVPHWERLKN